jgi:hypothetical protein
MEQFNVYYKGKGKADPLHAMEEESSYSCLTSARDGGEWSASRPGRALSPGIGPSVSIG